MSIKLAVPSAKIYEKFYSNLNISQYKEIELIRVNESEIPVLLTGNRISAGLMSPLGYTGGLIKADFRIIPGPALALVDYTEYASILFKSGLIDINTCATQNKDDFLSVITKILFDEKFGISLNLTTQKIIGHEIPGDNDCAIIYDKCFDNENALNLSEEWFDNYEMPLPLAFWVCHAEEYPENIVDIVNTISSLPEDDEIIQEMTTEDVNYSPREGRIINRWTTEVRDSVDQVLQLLYFHLFSKEIAAIKILGVD